MSERTLRRKQLLQEGIVVHLNKKVVGLVLCLGAVVLVAGGWAYARSNETFRSMQSSKAMNRTPAARRVRRCR